MSHFLADDGEKIHCHVSGDGPPMVLLHGWTSSHQEWFPFVPALQEKHRVYRWDARGHGGHALTKDAAPTAHRMARDLLNLLDHYGIEQAGVVGHSMGALTTWQFIRDHGSARLSRIALIDQSPRLMTDADWQFGIYGNFAAERSAAFIEDLKADFAESVLRLTANGLNLRAKEKYAENAKGWQRSREQLRAQIADPLIACWQSLVESDYRDVLEKIDVPALLIYGGESNFYHADTAHYVASRIPDAVLRIYEGTDHSPHQWQRERFVQDLVGFFAG
jgi:pimeloyl-ACP methyl ester carboxylesterase